MGAGVLGGAQIFRLSVKWHQHCWHGWAHIIRNLLFAYFMHSQLEHGCNAGLFGRASQDSRIWLLHSHLRRLSLSALLGISSSTAPSSHRLTCTGAWICTFHAPVKRSHCFHCSKCSTAVSRARLSALATAVTEHSPLSNVTERNSPQRSPTQRSRTHKTQHFLNAALVPD